VPTGVDHRPGPFAPGRPLHHLRHQSTIPATQSGPSGEFPAALGESTVIGRAGRAKEQAREEVSANKTWSPRRIGQTGDNTNVKATRSDGGRGQGMDGGDRVGHEHRLRAAVLAGDEAAWRAWYDTTAPGVRSYVHWRCGGLTEMADEIVQETWLTAVRRVRAFHPDRGPFAGWLCGIAANLIRNYLRSRRPCTRPCEVLESTPRCRSESDDTGDRVARALSDLPPHYEAVLRAKYLDGLSVRAIAADRAESPKAVESLLTRARQAFRDAYQAEESAGG
jgi:RNA polymerase sigma-70 factor (ECF subfamily)